MSTLGKLPYVATNPKSDEGMTAAAGIRYFTAATIVSQLAEKGVGKRFAFDHFFWATYGLQNRCNSPPPSAALCYGMQVRISS